MRIDANTVAVVTGGASGLGAATAGRLARAGAQVVIVDRDERLLRRTAADLDCHWARADITESVQVSAALDSAERHGSLRVLVNCAGIASGQTRTVRRDGAPHDPEAWRRVVDVNLVGTYDVCRLFAARSARTEPTDDGERGVIVLTASCAAFDGQAGQSAYAAAKAGLVGLTLPMARDLKPVGLRVNTIAPGIFDTPMLNPAGLSPVEQDALERRNDRFLPDLLFPARVGAPDEYARLVEHIIANSYLNAEVVRLDGGLRLTAR